MDSPASIVSYRTVTYYCSTLQVPVNWRMLSPFPFLFSFLFLLVVLKRRKGEEVVFGIENQSFVCTLPTDFKTDS